MKNIKNKLNNLRHSAITEEDINFTSDSAISNLNN